MASFSNGKPHPGGDAGGARGGKKESAGDEINEVMKGAAAAAAPAWRHGELTRASSRQENMVDMHRAHTYSSKSGGERNHAAKMQDMQHQRYVAVGAAKRGRRIPAPAATIPDTSPEGVAAMTYLHAQHSD